MGFMSDDIQPRAPVAASTASAMLPVLFSGRRSAAITASGDWVGAGGGRGQRAGAAAPAAGAAACGDGGAVSTGAATAARAAITAAMIERLDMARASWRHVL